MIPGMTRRMAEHRVLAEKEFSKINLETPLEKTGSFLYQRHFSKEICKIKSCKIIGNIGSFGCHALTAEESLYALDLSGRGSLVQSQSLTSVIGLTQSRPETDRNNFTVTAEICQVKQILYLIINY